MGSLECFLLGLNDFLGSKLFFNLSFNTNDGILLFDNEIFKVFDLYFNGFNLVGVEINSLLNGDLGRERFIL